MRMSEGLLVPYKREYEKREMVFGGNLGVMGSTKGFRKVQLVQGGEIACWLVLKR